MKLIIGLGNPGEKYQNTRHNIGFRIVDNFFRQNQKNFKEWQNDSETSFCLGKIGKEKVLLAKPQTFVNNSGKAVLNLTKANKIKINDIVIIHDDLDLKLGQIKISQGKGSAGHRGVQSIIKAMKSPNFIRVRIGTGFRKKIKDKKKKKEEIIKFVIADFPKRDEEMIKKAIKKISEALNIIISQGGQKAMNIYNQYG